MAELGLFGEVVVEVYDPDRNYRGNLQEWQALTARRERYGHEHLELTIPFEDPLFSMTHEKGTFGVRTFWQSKGAEWSFRVIARDYPVAFVDCVVTHCDYEDVFLGRTLEETRANVKIEALGFLDYILSARRVMGADLRRWKRENLKMDDVVKHIIQSNIDDSVTPAAYAALPASRTDFGSFTVDVAGTNIHPSAPPRVRVSHDTTLLDIVREFCHANLIGATAVCNTLSTPLVMIGITYPERGTDLSDKVIFSRGLNNLQGAKSSTDLLNYSNLFEVKGKAFRQRAKRGWVKIEEARKELGVRESGEKADDHWDDEIAQEASFLVSQAAQNYTHFEAQIVEGKRRWGYDFDVDDTVTLVDEVQGIMRIDRITKVEISSGSPTNLTVRFGHDGGSDNGGGGGSSRHGGGKGHRRTGTRTSDKVPEPEVHHTICPDEGERVIPTQALGRLRVYGDPDIPFNPWFTTGVNNGEDEDAIKELRGAVCEWEVPGPAAPGEVEREGKTKVKVPPQECCTEEQWVWCPGGWVEVFAKFCFKPGQLIGVVDCTNKSGSGAGEGTACCGHGCQVKTPSGNNDTCLDGHIYIELPSNDCRGPKLCAKCEGGEAEGTTKTKVPGQWEWDLWTGKCARDGEDRNAVISPAKRAVSTWVPNPTPPCPEP